MALPPPFEYVLPQSIARLPAMSMQSFREAAARLLAIDELQDDLLRQLEELEQRTEAVLREFLPAAAAAPAATAAQPATKSRQPGSRQPGRKAA